MNLTNAQKLQVKNALSSNSAISSFVSNRQDVAVSNWCNSESNTISWMTNVSSRDLFEMTPIAKYIALTVPARSAWDLMLRHAPIDFSRVKFRNALVDIWGTADANIFLNGVTEKATILETIIGGSQVSTNGVGALKRTVNGTVTQEEMSRILNGAF